MPEGKVVVNEVFYSIQGESSWAGRPCVFVRLTGCHLRCGYCDTEYAFYEGKPRFVEDVIEEVRGYGCDLVEVTGGEPLLQAGTPELCRRLCDVVKNVLIETSGACDISVLNPRVIRIMDLKCPSSGELERNRWSNLAHLRPVDEVKFVIGDRADFDWARNVLREHELAKRCGVLFSPVFEGIAYDQLAAWILEERLPVRMQLQMHKFIWSPSLRGV